MTIPEVILLYVSFAKAVTAKPFACGVPDTIVAPLSTNPVALYVAAATEVLVLKSTPAATSEHTLAGV